MKKLVFITSPVRPTEYHDHWSHMAEITHSELIVLDGHKHVKNLIDQVQNLMKSVLSKDVSFGFLIHDERWVDEIERLKLGSVSFIKHVSTEQSIRDLRIDYSSQNGFIAKLNQYSKDGNNIEISELIKSIWSEYVKPQEYSIEPIIPEISLDSATKPRRLLVLSNKIDSKYLQEYYIQCFRGVEIHENKIESFKRKRQKDELANLNEGVYIINQASVFESVLKSYSSKEDQVNRLKALIKLLNQFDFVTISAELDWYTNKDFAGYDLANEILLSSEKPVSLNIVSGQDLISNINQTTGIKRRLMEILPFSKLPFLDQYKLRQCSPMKWKALQMSIEIESLLNILIHDLKYQNSGDQLRQFILRVINYDYLFHEKAKKHLNHLAENISNVKEVKRELQNIFEDRKRFEIGANSLMDIKVLLVEDDAKQLEILKERLEDYFSQIVAVSEGELAIQKLDTEEFDLVLCDIELVKPLDEKGTMVYQDVWGVEVLDHASKKSKEVVLCALTALPKDNVEMMFGASSKIEQKVHRLYKDPNNDFLPVAYRWKEELESLYKEVKDRKSLGGPQIGGWAWAKPYREFYRELNPETKKKLWNSVEDALVDFDFDEKVLSNWGNLYKDSIWKRSKNERFSLLKRLLISRLLVILSADSGASFDWKRFTNEFFGEGSASGSTKSNLQTKLGFKYEKESIYYSASDLFPEELRIKDRVQKTWDKAEISEEKYNELVEVIRSSATYWKGLDEDEVDDLKVTLGLIREMSDRLKEIRGSDDYKACSVKLSSFMEAKRSSVIDSLEKYAHGIIKAAV